LSLESVVVTDLEFLGLAKKEGHQHQRVEREAREVEAEILPEKLSGTLGVANHPGGAVISESQATENERRMTKARKEIEAKIAAKVGKSAAPRMGTATRGETPKSGRTFQDVKRSTHTRVRALLRLGSPAEPGTMKNFVICEALLIWPPQVR
jgi:hypothetical protein